MGTPLFGHVCLHGRTSAVVQNSAAKARVTTAVPYKNDAKKLLQIVAIVEDRREIPSIWNFTHGISQGRGKAPSGFKTPLHALEAKDPKA